MHGVLPRVSSRGLAVNKVKMEHRQVWLLRRRTGLIKGYSNILVS